MSTQRTRKFKHWKPRPAPIFRAHEFKYWRPQTPPEIRRLIEIFLTYGLPEDQIGFAMKIVVQKMDPVDALVQVFRDMLGFDEKTAKRLAYETALELGWL